MTLPFDFEEYQSKAVETSIFPRKYRIIYPALGLGNEVGEVLGKIKKWMRGDDGEENLNESRRLAIQDELGDVLWYLAVLADDLGLELVDIAENNINKLSSRKARGTLRGDGDKR